MLKETVTWSWVFRVFNTLWYGKHDSHVVYKCAKVDPMPKADHTMQSQAKQSSRGSSFGFLGQLKVK